MKDLFKCLEQAISQANQADCPAVIGELERLKGLVWARLVSPQLPADVPIQSADNGRYLSVEEVASRFNVSDRWLYRHKKQIPHSQPSRKVLLFPEQAVTRWFASHKAG